MYENGRGIHDISSAGGEVCAVERICRTDKSSDLMWIDEEMREQVKEFLQFNNTLSSPAYPIDTW